MGLMGTSKSVVAASTKPLSRSKHIQWPRKRVLILGTGVLAMRVAEVLRLQKARPVSVVGFLTDVQSQVGMRLAEAKIIGTYDQLAKIADELLVEAITICLEDGRAILPVKTLLDLKTAGIEIVDGHRAYEDASGRLSIDFLRPSALIFAEGFKQRYVTRVIKRLFDVLLSSCGLVALLPLFLVVAILIKVDSPGPVLFRQIRVGLAGRPFLIWKFRSMQVDAEKSGARWAQVDDPRITRIGRWLRKNRIDELPQLINVLRGEMSLVGPRPERPMFVHDLRTVIPYYDIRHTVKPGVTGWAQVKFRYGASIEDSHMKLQYDLFYVKNLSLFLDLNILFRTVSVVIFGKGAY